MTVLSSFRSRGVVGLRKYKDLVFMITLLSLLCPASSWISKKELLLFFPCKCLYLSSLGFQQKMKENIQTLQEDAAMRKVDNKLDKALLTLLLEETKHATDLSAELLQRSLPELQLPIEQLKDLKRFLEESLDFMPKKFQNEAQQVKQYEDTLAYLKTFVSNLAEEHVDL